jgi:hypothetical protein
MKKKRLAIQILDEIAITEILHHGTIDRYSHVGGYIFNKCVAIETGFLKEYDLTTQHLQELNENFNFSI